MENQPGLIDAGGFWFQSRYFGVKNLSVPLQGLKGSRRASATKQNAAVFFQAGTSIAEQSG
jgi:hypothetical protein